MMARRKVNVEDEVQSLEQADELLARLTEIETVLLENDARMNERIAKTKLQFVAYAQPFLQERKEIELRLRLFAEAHREVFGAAKSRKLNNGVIGFRRSSEIKLRQKAEYVIQRIKDMQLDGLLLRQTTKIDKVQLAKQPADVLDAIGAEIRTKDTFFVATDVQQVEDVITDG